MKIEFYKKIPKSNEDLANFKGTTSTKIVRPRTDSQWAKRFFVMHPVKPPRFDSNGKIIPEVEGKQDPNYNPTAS